MHLFHTAVNENDVNSTKNVTSTLENNSVGDGTYILNGNTEANSTKNHTSTRENNSVIDGSYIFWIRILKVSFYFENLLSFYTLA